MRVIFFCIPVLFLTTAVSLPDMNRRWVIDPSSRLVIYGNTNVNRFVCSTDCYTQKDTLEYKENTNSSGITFFKNVMVIPVESFSCGNELITKDFRITLNAEKHPNLRVEFISLESSGHLFNGNRVAGKVKITLAGVSRFFQVQYIVGQDSKKNTLTLIGKQSVCFSDFQLKAPTKMMGLIKVEEEMEVEFQLRLIPV